MWYEVDLGPNFGAFNEITLDSGSSTNDYARSFTVYVLNPYTSNWDPLASVTATSPFTSVTFPEQYARYFYIALNQNIVDAKNTPWYWSIYNLGVNWNYGLGS